MAFLDFIKNRNQQPPAEPTQQQKPETAKEMYTREAAQEKANAKPVERGMTSEQRAVMSDVQEKMRSAMQPPEHTPPPSPASPGGATSPQPMAQKMENQDKAAPALSPTSMQSGARESEKDTPAPSPETKEKAPDNSPQRPQTIQRPTPSWER